MDPAEIFDVTLRRVRECQAIAEGLRAATMIWAPTGGTRRVGNRVAEFVAEFALAGRQALGRNPRWRARAELFRLYYAEGRPYSQAREDLAQFLKVDKLSPGTFDFWAAEIKKAVAPEIRRRGLFPPRLYFGECGPLEAEREARKAVRRLRGQRIRRRV